MATYQSSYTGQQIDTAVGKTSVMTVSSADVTFSGKVTITTAPTGNMDVVNKQYLEKYISSLNGNGVNY